MHHKVFVFCPGFALKATPFTLMTKIQLLFFTREAYCEKAGALIGQGAMTEAKVLDFATKF